MHRFPVAEKTTEEDNRCQLLSQGTDEMLFSVDNKLFSCAGQTAVYSGMLKLRRKFLSSHLCLTCPVAFWLGRRKTDGTYPSIQDFATDKTLSCIKSCIYWWTIEMLMYNKLFNKVVQSHCGKETKEGVDGTAKRVGVALKRRAARWSDERSFLEDPQISQSFWKRHQATELPEKDTLQTAEL